ncbi:hypothetical protein FRC17_009362 [Serendipita sp. 399]|nr:hypothetical protein FRC17_009362 [Serendipita sp. 399]
MLSVLEDDGTVSSTVRGGAYFPAPDELDPNVEINLSSLRDAPPDGKPLYSYATLIRYAIKGSPEGRLLLEEIYYAIEQRYPYFKTAPAGWKARSQLLFSSKWAEIKDRTQPLTDRGKGSYWTVDDSVDPKQGIQRIRNRRRKTKNDPGNNNPVPYPYPYGSSESGYDAYAAMYPYGYDPSMFPPHFLPQGSEATSAPTPFSDQSMGASADHAPENVDWRGMYLGELERLKNITREQDKEDAPQEWYRMMAMRLRMGMMGLPPFTMATIDPAHHGHLQNHGHGHQQHQHQQDHEAKDEDEDGELEDEEDD